jgi:hypothetical protein
MLMRGGMRQRYDGRVIRREGGEVEEDMGREREQVEVKKEVLEEEEE